ncbi:MULTISPECIES: ABC transporter ATP-binding protein [unclassified Salinibacterium]|uniref:ABC transporter ATP-binding protein n=1 Tax=unclassified Salinibacterium TaxID=2632331 RepID=UPI0018CCA7D1|nr:MULTISPECIES: ABC transporter ATP-binding protein [unclassified Salinibacterium]MBH0052652.1 ABC transporter ATP-binding protein [Salinibacterium sp. SWN139]MBH0081917.1 ABC transporter ATP-binding protein [Salinibacterium sp. SWN167]
MTGASEPEGSVVLEGVTKKFGGAIAVDNISLNVRPGEFLSLLGPSGCGKTTTLRMLAGFEEPTSGSIRISGQDVVGIPPHKRNVNTVFQAYALFPHMSVAENVAYGLRQKGTPKSEIRERVTESLDLVQMRSFADRKPTQLSGGQQQRIALARALINRPAVLLLDEPLGALDRQLREEMQIELKLLQSRLGITFIFVTHDQGEALSMSDRIAIMRKGRIEQLDDADSIYDSPASAYVAGFIGQQNFIAGTMTNDLSVMESPFGIINASGPHEDLAAGMDAQAAVRPEAVAVALATGDSTSTAANQIRGEVIGVSHQGETLQFLVSIGNDQTLLSRVPRPNAPRLAVGDSVLCTWDTASVHLFPSDQASQAQADIARAVSNPAPPTSSISL